MRNLLIVFSFFFITANAQQQVYELRTYELDFFKSADILHNYFKDALFPALNRQGINNIGVFEEVGESLPKKIYVLIPYDDLQDFQSSKRFLARDTKYFVDARPYMETGEESHPYKRLSTNLIASASGFPNLISPNGEASFFELRIYDSYNEDALQRKVRMFNNSEFKIFEEVGLPMVFFGPNITGNQMPNLTYLLAFKDKAAHAEAWSKFLVHPEWLRILKLEEYANTINKITRVFLKPLPYSQL